MFDPHDPHDRAMQEADDRDAEYHEGLDALDRLNAQGPHPSTATGAHTRTAAPSPSRPRLAPAAVDTPLAHVEQPSERERREHRLARAQEREAVTRLYPRPRLVQVSPRSCPIHDDDPGVQGPEAA